MKLILGNLSQLKVFLLNESLRTDTQWDDALEVLGKGVAGRMQSHCNRLFERTVGDIYETTADRMHVILPRYPIEATPTIALREDLATGYVAQTYNDLVIDHNLANGLIQFGAMLGSFATRLKFTYTGGYWVPDDDAATPEDDADLPSGASLVPSDLRLAWLLQCQRIWSVRDNLGVDVSGERSVQFVSSTLAGLELVPEVKEMLRGHTRYALT